VVNMMMNALKKMVNGNFLKDRLAIFMESN